MEQELIPCCNRYGMEIVIYNPLAGGLFSGKIKSAAVPAEGRYSDTSASGRPFAPDCGFRVAPGARRTVLIAVCSKDTFNITTLIDQGMLICAEGQNYRKRYFRDATFDALRLIEPVVQEHSLTMLEVALRWCAHHSALKIQNGGTDGIIVGVSSLAQLEGNLKDLEKGPLPEEVVKILDEAWLVTKATTPNYWHLDLKYTYDTQQALFGAK